MVAFLSIALMRWMSTPGTQPCDPSSAFLPCAREVATSFSARNKVRDRGSLFPIMGNCRNTSHLSENTCVMTYTYRTLVQNCTYNRSTLQYTLFSKYHFYPIHGGSKSSTQ
jgi:hypothetical protein